MNVWSQRHGQWLATVLILTAGAFARAESLETTEGGYGLEESTFDVGFNLYQFDYREDVPMPLKSTETGFQPGLRVGLDQRLGDLGWRFFGNAEASFSSTVYDGSTQSGRPIVGETSNRILRLEALIGKALIENSQYSNWIPYAGLGVHHWIRDSSAMRGGYLEKYTFLYLPVGLKYFAQLSSAWRWEIDASLRANLGGHIDFAFSDIDSRLADGGSSLGSALGGRIEMPVSYQMSDGFAVRVAPYFEYFGIGEGAVTAVTTTSGVPLFGAHEPASRTYMYGASISSRLMF